MISTDQSWSRSSQRRIFARELVANQLRAGGGDQVADEEFCRQHPELMPELAEEIQRARSIGTAIEQADELICSQAMRRLMDEGSDDNVSTCDRFPVDADDDYELPDRVGRYRIERVIGDGSFGRVYLAWDEELSRRVAIKTPHRHRILDAASAASFLAEARLLAKLDHPAIVPVYDAGKLDDGGCYVVSKWLAGTNLAERLRSAALPYTAAMRLTLEIAGALHYAHLQGVVHRDIKPANILLDDQDRPCLVDFGLALHDDDPSGAGCWAGTPRYMSPEQARGEAHRVDGRSDIFSLGVVLYECLTGRRPFDASSYSELLEQITSVEPRPLRDGDNTIPAELERICLKMLAKRAGDRYESAKDLVADLQHLLHPDRMAARPLPPVADVDPANAPSAPHIVPKGLRCFDADDASFFLDLLPGPRDRQGIPESLRRWKRRIEMVDDESFAVGLLYGPSGCGKSSLVRAGLLPLLAGHVEPVYVEATADDTELQLLKRLQRKIPDLSDLPGDTGLAKCLAALRRGAGLRPGHKRLIVIDQFEQWLSGRSEVDRRTLIESLRQCDGTRLQCLLLVRDDFWLAVSRFMSELEVELIQGFNTSLVDLFDPQHAQNVLVEIGKAYHRLPDRLSERSSAQQEFLERGIAGLTEDGKVIPVRLALFAEMVKGRPWTPETLRSLGGSQGVGVTFLEETFCSRGANPQNRLHERGARAVLEALLPRPGSPIKGHFRSYPELMDLAGYGQRPREFKELMRILDSETRLLTPADRVADESSPNPAIPPVRYYQLTHDYLVPSLRDWLTRKQKATSAGRAVLRLTERTALWESTGEQRQLPSLWEWLTIQVLTRGTGWTSTQRRMMRVAAWRHALWSAAWLMAALLLLIAGTELTSWARNLSVAVRATTAPLWLAFGQEDAVLPLLQADTDATLRTRLIHQLSPLVISPERLVSRATEPANASQRRALLLCAGEMAPEHGSAIESTVDARRPVSETMIQQLLSLYQNDPDPGVHAAAEWALYRFRQEAEIARLQSGWRTTAAEGERQWIVTPEDHTLVIVPGPARFRMGAIRQDVHEQLPGHDELIRRSFCIATKETTVAQFQRFLLANPPVAQPPDQPASRAAGAPQLQVTWYQAAEYCNWLSEREGFPRDQWCFVPATGGTPEQPVTLAANWRERRGYRLPSEAEWEYACRAGTETAWYFGSDSTALSKFAHGADYWIVGPAIVGQRKPNELGLFDMLGNAAEWCMETFQQRSTIDSSTDASVARVTRGGSFLDAADGLRTTSRTGMLPGQAAVNVGFRVARSYP